ncbi:MAG TPA: restriction endonuclease subunit S [Thermoanaerobaculia bacterium]
MSYARPIKDFCIGIFDGPHATPKESLSGPIFLGIKNITEDGRLDLSEIRHVTEEEFPRWTKRVTPRVGDVVFTYEATLHRYAVIPEDFRGCLGRRVALVRPDPRKADSRYLLYYFLSRRWRALMQSSILTGATVDRIPIANFPNFPITLPTLQAQRRTAQVLTAYDDLIENNRRRLALLEESARQLYREWFVRLRFPGYEHTRIVGELEGWERRSLSRCATFFSGGTPSKAREDFWDGDIPWASSGELTELRIADTALKITAEAAEAGSRMVPHETILAVVRGMSLAKEWRISLTSREMAFNQDLKAIIANDDVDPLYLFHALDAQRDQVRDRAGEASHGTKKLETAVLSSLPILVPPASLQTLFREHVEPMHAQWDNLHRQNEKLRAARDLLLPRLMSGELVV